MLIARIGQARNRFRRPAGIVGVALALALAVSPCTANDLEVVPGAPLAPVLDLEDLAGHGHRLSEYQGRVVLINFWGSWCGPCVAEMPRLQRLQDSLAGKPFSVVMVNLGESRLRIRHFRDQRGLSLDFLIDRAGDGSREWGVDIVPASFLVDAQGRVRYRAEGEMTWDEPAVRARMEELIEEVGKAPRPDSAPPGANGRPL